MDENTVVGSDADNCSLYALANIIDDLKGDDLADRINSLKRLSTVAVAIGPVRTREELIPFLVDATNDEDELISVLVEQLENFHSYLGGPEYAHTMLPILETVMGMEEPLCRNGAVKVVNEVVVIMPQEHVIEHIIPLIRKFISEEWFTFHLSLTGIISKTYTRMDDESLKLELREIFYNLCSSDVPITRRSAATQLNEFLAVIDKNDIQQHILPSFIHLINDEQDTVRVMAVATFPSMVAIVKDDPDQTTLVLNELTQTFKDRSWRIRYKVTEILTQLTEAVSAEYFTDVLIPSFCKLLSDTEPEVRTCATLNIIEFCEKIPAETVADVICDMFIATITELVSDISINVKSAAAKILLSLSKFLGRQKTIKLIMPLFRTALKDQSSEVRLNLISNLGNINDVIGPSDLSNSLLPAIMELSNDPKWRVRIAVISFVPLLAEELGIEFFDDKLTNLCLEWLQDSVYNVRYEAGVNIIKLINNFGAEWATKYVIPKLEELAGNKCYLLRLTCLFTINMVSESKEIGHLSQQLTSIVKKLLTDNVPNVRFNAAKTIKCISTKFNVNSVSSEVMSSLLAMSHDSDTDVRFFAKDTLTHLETLVQ